MPWREAEVVNLRQELVLKALGGAVEFGALCAEFGISRKTGYKWVARFREQGLGGLRNQSRRPHGSPAALSEEVICELVRIKGSVPRSWGPKKVLSVYQRQHGSGEAPSLSSVQRVLDKMGFVSHRRRSRQGEPARVQEGMVPDKPNALWTVDFKGWWKTRDRARCEPLTVRDGFSRFLLDLRAMESTAERVVRPAFEGLFETYGMPAAIRSDNGTPFAASQAPLGLSRLSAWWVSLGIRLDRIDPGHPEQNGAHERIHRDIRAELQVQPADGVEQSQALFDEWRHTFNWQRPHEALGMKTPGSVYTPSTLAYDPSHVEIAYPPDWLERLVSPSGCITLCSVPVYISLALAGFVIGLQPVADRLDVWFDYLRLGHIDLHVMRFIPLTENKKRRRSSSGRLAARRRNAGGLGPSRTGQPPPSVLPMS
jgi:transposase InsO family protein